MDPFYASSSAHLRAHDRGERGSVDLQAQDSNKPHAPSPSTLRRSTGLFNLKLKSSEPPGGLRLASSNASTETLKKSGELRSQTSDAYDLANMTPDATLFATAPPIDLEGRVDPRANPLKRPNPFAATKTGILGLSNRNTIHSKKRFNAKENQHSKAGALPHRGTVATDHLTSDLNKGLLDVQGDARVEPSLSTKDQVLTPEVSFKGAKPVQTAFAPSGLLSKRSISDSPKLRVPETPCKRHVADTSSIDPPPLPSWPLSKPPNARVGESSPTSRPSCSPEVRLPHGVDRRSHPAPVDRLQRFSLSHIELDTDLAARVGSGPAPDTPTRYPYTSTPLRKEIPAQRYGSDASTVTPGTIVRPLPSVLRQLDEPDSLALSPPHVYNDPRAEHSPRTPDVDDYTAMNPDFASPLAPRIHTQSDLPELPDLTLHTPAGKTRMPADSSPHTPGRATPVHMDITHYDELLAMRFGKVQSAAVGEFSIVFIVTQGKYQYAVKRTKRPIASKVEGERRREEIDILRSLSLSMELTSFDADDHGSSVPHIVQFVDEWITNDFGYIRTEFCENGDLSRFLAAQGRVSRLEEWRVWKILLESLMGLSVIHNAGILHLDLKPANILVTFEGHLKIGDFGMATRYPVPAHFEREGDREYIAPEVLQRHEYGPPADVFSLGLMMVEVAANIVLPDNGEHWHRLRSGDLSDAGRLSSGDLTLADCLGSPSNKLAPPSWAPPFLVDGSRALDRVVQHMLRPEPALRPSVDELLAEMELIFVANRRQAGAIVYEGEFGPKPDNEIELNAWQRA